MRTHDTVATLDLSPEGREAIATQWQHITAATPTLLEGHIYDKGFDLQAVVAHVQAEAERAKLSLPSHLRLFALSDSNYVRHGHLFISLDEWVGVGPDMQGTVLVVPPWSGTPTVRTWAEIRSDHQMALWPRCWVGAAEPIELEDLPFRYSSSDWLRTPERQTDGTREHILWLNGTDYLPLYTCVEFYYEDTPPGAGNHRLIDVEWSRSGQSSDDLGFLWFTVDAAGGVACTNDSYLNAYLGRIWPRVTVMSLIRRHMARIQPTHTKCVQSEILDAKSLRPVLRWLARTDLSFDPGQVVVSATDFTGTAAELLHPTSTRTRRTNRPADLSA